MKPDNMHQSILRVIRAYYSEQASHEHHRYRSWEHCYQFFRRFRQATQTERDSLRDSAALQLGFYLASWGMLRGSTFLLQRTYTVHLGVIDRITDSQFLALWKMDLGSDERDRAHIPTVLDAIQEVRKAYEGEKPTDTLVTKVILGTLGCLPACDKYFIDGFRSQKFSFSKLNRQFIEQLLQFCSTYSTELRSEQKRIATSTGVHYPLMKLVDMYFWQLGYEKQQR